MIPSTLAHDDPFVGQLEWDEDSDSPKEQTPQEHGQVLSTPPNASIPREETPLLAKKPSKVLFWDGPHPMSGSSIPQNSQDHHFQVPSYLSTPPPCRRRMSGGSVRSCKSMQYHNFGGQSTYGQTVCLNICSGHLRLMMYISCSIRLPFFSAWECCLNHWRLCTPVGLWALFLSSHMVSFLVIRQFLTFSSHRSCAIMVPCSAKVLGRIILSDPRIRSYSDIGRKAFGPVATLVISFMFCLELFAVRSVSVFSASRLDPFLVQCCSRHIVW